MNQSITGVLLVLALVTVLIAAAVKFNGSSTKPVIIDQDKVVLTFTLDELRKCNLVHKDKTDEFRYFADVKKDIFVKYGVSKSGVKIFASADDCTKLLSLYLEER